MWDQALELLDRTGESDRMPSRIAEHFRSWIYCSRGDYHKVRSISQEAGSQGAALEAPLAIAYAGLGEFDAARALANQAIQKRRSLAEYAMGRVLQAAGDREGALLSFERAGKRIHERSAPLRSAASILTELGCYDEGRHALEQAIRLAPFVRYSDLERLGECYSRMGYIKRAKEAEALAMGFKARDSTARSMWSVSAVDSAAAAAHGSRVVLA